MKEEPGKHAQIYLSLCSYLAERVCFFSFMLSFYFCALEALTGNSKSNGCLAWALCKLLRDVSIPPPLISTSRYVYFCVLSLLAPSQAERLRACMRLCLSLRCSIPAHEISRLCAFLHWGLNWNNSTDSAAAGV